MASYEERILKVIEDSEVGLTTVDVAKKAGVSKTTAIKYLSVLKSEGKCQFVEIGPSKLWMATSKPEAETEVEPVAESIEAEVAKISPQTLSVIAQLKDISDDVTVSMSFKVKPENMGTFMKLMREYMHQEGHQEAIQ